MKVHNLPVPDGDYEQCQGNFTKYFARSLARTGKLKLLFHTPNEEARRIRKKYSLQKESKHQMNYGMILAV